VMVVRIRDRIDVRLIAVPGHNNIALRLGGCRAEPG
jgi:hypothetical protein